MIRNALVLVLVSLPVPARPALPQSGNPPPIQAVDSTLTSYVHAAGAFGVSGVVLVSRHGQILLHTGVGWRDPATTQPCDTMTLFYIASLLKQFVAAGILRLQEQHRLHLTDSIGDFFPDVPPDKTAITLEELLTHTSGLPRYGWDPIRRDWANQTRVAAIHGILDTPLENRPGQRYAYNNVNYVLLSAIIEHVAHTSYQDYLASQFLKPLGLRHTFIGSRIPDSLRNRVAWSLGDRAESFTILDRAANFLNGNGGAITTAGDLHRWVRALVDYRILSAASVRRLWTIGATISPHYGYGAGWLVRTDSAGSPLVIFHGGDFRGYHSEVRYYPTSDLVMIALTNAGVRGWSVTQTLLNHLVDISHGWDNPLPSTRTGGGREVAGTYRAATGDVLTIRSQGPSLVVEATGQRALDQLDVGDTTGWQVRNRAMQAAMTLVGQLNRRQVPPERIDDYIIPPLLRRELGPEWQALRANGGRLKSYQQLGARATDVAGVTRAVVRLVFERDSLLYGVDWTGDTLTATIPGPDNLVEPPVFAQVATGEWRAFDWPDDAMYPVTLIVTPSSTGRPASVVLRSDRVEMTFHRR